MCFLLVFYWQKVGSKLKKSATLTDEMICFFGLVGVGGRGGVPGKRLKSIHFRIQHAALKVAADLWATASSADLQMNPTSTVNK